MTRRKVVCKHCNKEIAINMIQRHEEPCSRKTKRRDSVPIESISSLLENGKYSCNGCGKEYVRQGISTHYWLNHGDGDNHLKKIQEQLQDFHESKKGKPSWNSGLTSKNDERVAKSRDTLLKRVESGQFMPNRKGIPLKASTKEKLSEARSKFLNERGNGGFRDIKWFKSIDSFGNECTLRGTWEVKVSEWLNHQGVMWTRKHYIKYIDDNINRTYSPDFYIPNDDLIIEVKGYYSERDKRKMSLISEQYPQLKIKFIMKNEIEHIDSIEYNKL